MMHTCPTLMWTNNILKQDYYLTLAQKTNDYFHGIKAGEGAIKAAHTYKLQTYAYPSFGITLLYPTQYPNPNPNP